MTHKRLRSCLYSGNKIFRASSRCSAQVSPSPPTATVPPVVPLPAPPPITSSDGCAGGTAGKPSGRRAAHVSVANWDISCLRLKSAVTSPPCLRSRRAGSSAGELPPTLYPKPALLLCLATSRRFPEWHKVCAEAVFHRGNEPQQGLH